MILQVLVLLALFCVNSNALLQFEILGLKQSEAQLKTQTSKYDMWIEQKLDNFHPTDYRVWMQRYFMQSKYSKLGGPVFLQIGGEGPANPVWMEQGHWITMAKKFGAMCFFLEHRFYGKSHPTNDTSIENLSFLSSEQALGDVANFIVKTTSQYNLQGRKWIVFGGSYSGALSIWARLKYPHLVFGSVSASAPLNALLDFSEYLEVVANSLHTYGGGNCVGNVAEATMEVALHLASSEGRQALKDMFHLCDALDGTEFDNKNLQQVLAGNIMGVVQYNKDNRAFEGALGTNITIETVCSIMDDVSLGSALERYAAFNQINMKAYNMNCVNASYSKFISGLRKISWDGAVGGRTWLFQTCTEFGWYQSSNSPSQPFIGFPLDFTLDQCMSVFGISPSQIEASIARTNTVYGALQVANIVSNVVLYNGGVDPWSAVSYVDATKQINSRFSFLQQSGIVTVPVPDTAHCAITYPASPTDSQALTQARLKVEQVVASWIGIR